MLRKRHHRRGFKLLELLLIQGVLCVVCCIAFPHFVGPVDLSSGSVPVHDPSCRIYAAYSPSGTQAYVEVGPPRIGMPGSIIVNIVNDTRHRIDHATVRYPLSRPIIYNPRAIDPDVRVTRNWIFVRFDALDPNIPVYKALNYRDPGIPVVPHSPADVIVPPQPTEAAVRLSMASQ